MAVRYDLIIVGAGLAGSALGKAMAEHGAPVLILERERQIQGSRPRRTPATNWLSAAQEYAAEPDRYSGALRTILLLAEDRDHRHRARLPG